jgi:hypothetical protein
MYYYVLYKQVRVVWLVRFFAISIFRRNLGLVCRPAEGLLLEYRLWPPAIFFPPRSLCARGRARGFFCTLPSSKAPSSGLTATFSPEFRGEGTDAHPA